ncbi:MAG: InlB B-repeat-containing protein, partial [Dehalococcoidia bacterium]|nr:InlB B-repeat-containing protein [Dehalococcoidia bacterium]
MKYRIGRIISGLLVAVFLFTCINPLLTPLSATQREYFTIDFLSDLRGINLSGIKVDIYESTISSYDAITSSSGYSHSFSYSAYSDTEGSVAFVKPSDCFLVKVDLETLPYDTGVDKDLVFYGDASQEYDSRFISQIAEVVIDSSLSSLDFVKVDIFNALGNIIKAHFSVTPDNNYVANARASIINNAVDVSGYVTVGSHVERYEYTIVDNTDPVILVANALEAGRISKEEALDLFMDTRYSDYAEECGTYLVSQLVALYEDKAFYSQLPIDKQEALEAIVTPKRTRGDAEYHVPNSYFIIYFNHPNYSGVTANPPQLIQEIGEAFKDAYAFFIDTLGYQEPGSVYPLLFWMNNEYHVYIRDYLCPTNSNYAAWCHPDSGATSFIEVFDTPFLDRAINDAEKSRMAHEYFHSIECKYRPGFVGLPEWYIEGFAVWGQAMCCPSITSSYYGRMNQLLWDPEKSLLDCKYDAVLLSVYLYMNYGGYSTIKAIVQGTSSSADVIAIINSVTQSYSGKSFKDVFAQFWADNYTPQGTYSAYASGLYYTPYIAKYFNSYPTNDPVEDIIPLSSRFLEFDTPSYSATSWNIEVTIDLTKGLYSNFASYLLLRNSNTFAIQQKLILEPSSSFWTFASPITVGNNSIDRGCVMPVNLGTSGNIDCTLTIEVNAAYAVTINDSYVSNSGAGNYQVGTTVNINAGNRSGYEFNGWSVQTVGVTLTDSSKASTSFTMPNKPVSIYANWKPIVTVYDSYANPTGAGSYAQGSTVTINAGSRSGYTFSHWSTSSSGVYFNNQYSATTTFSMPNNTVTVTANWNQVSTPNWVTYAESILYPYSSGYEWMVPIEVYYNGVFSDSYSC